MPDPNEFFKALIAKIDCAYTRLGYDLNWKFLYSPQNTLRKGQRLFFLGLNPGGEEKEEISQSFEKGNAYLHDDWGSGPGQYPLQIQVQGLYRELAEAMNNGTDYKELMDNSFAANYIPFRSPRWNSLDNKSGALDFAHSFWPAILDYCEPRAIISIAKEPYGGVRAILLDQGFVSVRSVCEPINWGKATYTLERFSKGDRSIAMLRLPHLSQYRIFSRERCQQPRRKAIAEIAQALR